MGNKVSTCLYIDRAVLETARQVGLNISKVAENGLIEAVGRLTGTEPAKGANGSSIGAEKDGSPGEIRTLVSGSRARHP